jgi:peptide/nickel transport system permease protein
MQTIIVLFVVSFLVFLLFQLIPGDPVYTMLGPMATPEKVEAMRQELWLDRAILVQYGHWLTNAFRGDLGKSIMYEEDVTTLFAKSLSITGLLSLLALIITIIIGILSGIICAIRRGGILDSVITLISTTGIAIPIFWLGLLGIYFLGLKLDWLPIQGYTSPFVDFKKSIPQMIMPVFCLAAPSIAVIARQTRSSMLEVVRQDYIRTAISKGLRERVVVLKHALKNALIPIVTLLGMQVRVLIGGSVLTETVFNIPGMGRLLVNATFEKDFLVVQGGVLVMAVVVCLVNLVVDISYGWLDPRIKYE